MPIRSIMDVSKVESGLPHLWWQRQRDLLIFIRRDVAEPIWPTIKQRPDRDVVWHPREDACLALPCTLHFSYIADASFVSRPFRGVLRCTFAFLNGFDRGGGVEQRDNRVRNEGALTSEPECVDRLNLESSIPSAREHTLVVGRPRVGNLSAHPIIRISGFK